MATNYFLPFATNANANLINFDDWSASSKRLSGFVSGIARSDEMNRVFAQGANMSFAVADYIKTTISENVDVSSATTLATQFKKALDTLSKLSSPIGTVISYLGTSVPDGYLLCNGASVSRTDYAELFAVIGTKFGSDNSSTFKLPNLHHRFLEGTTTASEVGSYVEAGLPNITGMTTAVGYVMSSAEFVGTGCFGGMFRWDSSLAVDPTSTGRGSVIQFNASLSNSTYGNTTTVQPNSFRSFVLIRAY